MKAVIVTTDRRGVFFGYATAQEIKKEVITLKDPQMCVYWSADVKGIMGLASHGPTENCRITRLGSIEIQLRGITAVIGCSEQAEVAWKAAPWK